MMITSFSKRVIFLFMRISNYRNLAFLPERFDIFIEIVTIIEATTNTSTYSDLEVSILIVIITITTKVIANISSKTRTTCIINRESTTSGAIARFRSN